MQVDPNQRSLLVNEGAAGATLPVLELEENAWSGNASTRLQEMLRREHGLDNAILWCALEQIDAEAQQTLIIFAVELLDDHPILPAGTFWIDRGRLATLPLAQPDRRASLVTSRNQDRGDARSTAPGRKLLLHRELDRTN